MKKKLNEIENLDWDQLIREHSLDLSLRFPIMVIGRSVYLSNKEAIESSYSHCVFINTLPSATDDFKNSKNTLISISK